MSVPKSFASGPVIKYTNKRAQLLREVAMRPSQAPSRLMRPGGEGRGTRHRKDSSHGDKSESTGSTEPGRV